MYTAVGEIAIHPIDLRQIVRSALWADVHLQLLMTAVVAVQQIRKDALFAILRFRRTALCPLDDLLLYLLNGVPVDNRLVNILEDDPVFFRVIDADPSDFGKLTEEVETLAGLLLEIKGDFPRRREIIDFKEYRFQVLEVDNRRILKV